MTEVTLSQTFLDVIGPELRKAVNWDKRLQREESGSEDFGAVDGTFGDVISLTGNGSPSSLSLEALFFSYGLLLADTQTPAPVIAALLPPLTEAFERALKTTPLEDQDARKLSSFMYDYVQARHSGRFDAQQVKEIGKVLKAMSYNYIQITCL